MRDPLSVLTDAFTSFLFGKVETTRLPVRTSTGQAQAVYLPTAAPAWRLRRDHRPRGLLRQGLHLRPLPVVRPAAPGPALAGPRRVGQRQVGAGEDVRPAPAPLPRPPGRRPGRPGRGRRRRVEPHRRGAGHNSIRLDPMAALDHGIRLNPLDPAITTTGQLALLRTIIEVAMGHGLDERSGFALKVAHAYVNETIVERQPVLTDIVERLRHPEPESAEAMNVAITTYGPGASTWRWSWTGSSTATCAACSTVRRPSASTSTPRSSSSTSPTSTATPSRCPSSWPSWACGWSTPGSGRTGRSASSWSKKAWHIINSPFVAQLFQRLLKFGRRLGLSFVAVVHHLSDVVDGAAAREAAAILKMASTPHHLRPEGRRGTGHRTRPRPAPLGGGDHPLPHPRHRGVGRQRQRPGGRT
ncbi:ATP-binding protein [Streptomyces violaceorubidus]